VLSVVCANCPAGTRSICSPVSRRASHLTETADVKSLAVEVSKRIGDFTLAAKKGFRVSMRVPPQILVIELSNQGKRCSMTN